MTLRLLPLAGLLAFALAAMPVMAQNAQAPAVQPAPANLMLQAFFGLAIVLALLAGAAWVLKRFNPIKANHAGHVRIVGGVSVGSRERVIVVEVADQWIVVGVAPGNVNALSTLPRQELPSSGSTHHGAAPSRNFSSWLKHSIDQRNGRP